MKTLSRIGGTESFFFYIAKMFQDRDIAFMYKIGNAAQVNRLKKYAPCIQFQEGQTYECDEIFFNYTYDIIDSINAKQYSQVFHTDYDKQDVSFAPHPKITRYIAPTEIVARGIKKKFGIECEVIANPIILDKPQKVLRLISATRLTKEKRKG